MLNQATQTKSNQDEIVTAPLNEVETMEIDKENWTQFLNDFSKLRCGWKTKVEVLDESLGDQILSNGLSLNGITHDDKSGHCKIEISLGDNPANHQAHTIMKPTRIVYLSETNSHDGVLEFAEANNTKTLLSLAKPATP